jgi:CRP-like cAMP-binding protein
MTELEVLLNRRFLADESGVSPTTRQLLASGGYTEDIFFQRETVIVSEGTVPDALYFTLGGLFHASSKNNPKGANRLLGTIEQAEFIGEVTLIEGAGTAASATVKAAQNARALKLTREAFERFRTEHPAAALELVTAIAKQLCRRLRHANATVL